MENRENIKIAINKIIAEQELIIGPLARELATNTKGIKSTPEGFDFETDYKQVINNLSNTYKDIFGDIALQVTQEVLIKYHLDIPIQ